MVQMSSRYTTIVTYFDCKDDISIDFKSHLLINSIGLQTYECVYAKTLCGGL